MVECDLAKVEVAGSNPVSRSRIRRPRHVRGFFASFIFEARYPSGKGEVCKTFIRRFDSDPRLQHFPSLPMQNRVLYTGELVPPAPNKPLGL